MKPCKRDCKFRNQSEHSFFREYTCNCLKETGQSRVKTAYELTGDKMITKRVLELLEPENCPCYVWDGKAKKKPAPPMIRKAFDEDKFRELHALGKTDSELGRVFGVATTTAQKWRIKLGLPANRGRGWHQVDWEQARKLHNEGKTDREIAAALDCAVKTVRSWRAREGRHANKWRGTDNG